MTEWIIEVSEGYGWEEPLWTPRFDTEEEAVAMANDSTYGLAAGFWTNDVARTQRVANALQAGQIFINKYGCYEHTSPFGGYKQSGWGMECGTLSIDLYTKRKSIWYAY